MAYCYFDGKIEEESLVSIPIHNIGVHRSLGIFDFFRARDGKPTFMEDYLNRFDRSQEALHLSRKVGKEEIRKAVRLLMDANGYMDCSFKLMLLADGLETDEVLNPLFFIINKPLKSPETITPGKLISHEYVRDTPVVKHINYSESFKLQQARVQAGAIDVLFHKDGLVSEASRSNLFIVKNGRILTSTKNILEGITRKHVLKMMDGKWDCGFQDFSLDDVMSADEVFLTSTVKEVMPIVEIDGKAIGDGPGKITTELFEEFRRYIQSH